MESRIELLKSKKLIGIHKEMCLANNKTGELWQEFMKSEYVLDAREHFEIPPIGYCKNYSNATTYIFSGGTIGFDFHFWKLSINLMFGIYFRQNFEDSFGIKPTGEMTIYYTLMPFLIG